MTDLVKSQKLTERANFYEHSSLSENTKRAYQSDWLRFCEFCDDLGHNPLPASPTTVVLYITQLAENDISVSTIIRNLTSISCAHKMSNQINPVKDDRVSRVMSGIRRTKGRQLKQAKAITWADLRKMIDKCDPSMIGIRDAAILAIGWTAALRRSEIVALNLSDLDFSEEGIIVTIRRSKTDQIGKGKKIGIPKSKDKFCPVKTIRDWYERRYRDWRLLKKPVFELDTPLFIGIGMQGAGRWFTPTTGVRMTSERVMGIVKKYAALARLTGHYSAHSLRRGLATEAGARAVPERIIKRQTRHQSLDVLRRYIDDGSIWTDNPLPTIYAAPFGAQIERQ